MRHLIAILALALSACASVPDRADPNLLAQLQSAENQRRDIAAAEQARATANAEAIKACATAADQSACFMGVALVNGAGNARAAEQPVIAPYTPPPSFGQQALQVLSGLSPLFQVAGNVITQNHAADVNAKTQQVIAGYTAARETAQTQAWASAVNTIATTDAARPPSIQIGNGGVLAQGPVTQNTAGGDINTGTHTTTTTTTTVGGDQIGGDQNGSHNTNCTAGNGGPVTPTPTTPTTPATGTTTTPPSVVTPGGNCTQGH